MPQPSTKASPYCWQGDDLYLNLYIQPKASRDQYCGLLGDEIKLQITAPPNDGKANAHLTAYLAKLFRAPKKAVQLIKGETSRHKRVCIHAPKNTPEWIERQSPLVSTPKHH